MVSKPKNLIGEDINRWARNIVLFSSPALLVLFADVQELIPNNSAYGALMLALYGIGMDLFRKWLRKNKY